MKNSHLPLLLPLVLILAVPSTPLRAYSVLTHEAIIDSAWSTDIEPRLRQRFPQATEDDLRKAHAYAYGGSIIQDMGYYPFGSKFFSDLVHYVRSGDFVAALFAESETLDEYAFAFGALAHYAADINGHSVAVNRAVPLAYPKLAQKFGPVVTYADDPTAHMKTEFGFDVLQVARGRYAPQSYHDFIGFEVARDVLDRAFHDIYSMHIQDIFVHDGLSLDTYRYAVSTVIPRATRIAGKLKEKDIVREQPGATARTFRYNLSRASFEKEWGRKYHRPGVKAQIVAGMLRVVPKVGPFKVLAFKAPTAQTDRMFETSFNRTLDEYRALMRRLPSAKPALTDINLDTGDAVIAGKYRLADRAYAKLVQKLAERNFAEVSDPMRRDILTFYRQPPPQEPGRPLADWDKTMAAVDKLRATQEADRSPQMR